MSLFFVIRLPREMGGLFRALGLAFLAPSLGAAADPSPAARPDKSPYHLFNPTPRELMRELSADRPDKTETPYTVDAGHFQIEADFLVYTMDHEAAAGTDTRIESFSLLPINFKVGLLNRVDLELIVPTYNWVTVEDRVQGTKARHAGLGDITPRVKINIWGNDRGKTALALLPALKLPTSQDHLGNGKVEGALNVPFAIELPAGWDLGLTSGAGLFRDEPGGGYHAEYVNSVAVGHDIAGRLAGYLEFWSQVSAEPASPWQGTLDFGLTYGLTRDLQLDAGLNIGVTDSADDLNPFVGLTWRF